MEKVLVATRKGNKSVLSQMRYTTVPKYITIKYADKNSSILGMTKYDVGAGVKEYAAFTGKDK